MDPNNFVAVIGMAARTSGAMDIDALWDLVLRGGQSARLLTVQEQVAAGIAPTLGRRDDYVALSNPIVDFDRFDAGFFGFGEREAEILDPQRRMLFETAWSAFEDAGQIPGAVRTGTFMAVNQSEYFLLNLASHPELFDTLGGMMLGTFNGQDFAATQLAYKLDLRGPALNINTACSGSLVAVHTAINSLLGFECDLAIAGGASLVLAQRNGYVFKAGGINSRAGCCRPFDADADGTLPGSGTAILVLKRLEDAIRDRDPIRALVRGSAINNDGAAKVGFTAPSMDGQVEVIREALGVAGVGADAIDYIETHGTGTALGDSLEFAALSQVFGRRDPSVPPLRLGALKGNIGHANAAAGAAALIKTVLSLQRHTIPPLANFATSGLGMDLDEGPLRAPRAAQPWFPRPDRRRFAGVSSFGIGGTNAHVIVEEAPATVATNESLRPQMIVLSAHTPKALAALCRNMAERLPAMSESVADAAYTLALGRKPLSQRLAVVGEDRDALARQLIMAERQALQAPSTDTVGPIAWLISGQGEACLEQLRDLYRMEPTFRQVVETCREILESIDPRKYTGLWRNVLRSELPLDVSFHGTAYQQPLLFVFAFAQARLFESWGLRPAALLGHSLGEYVAAGLAGLFSLEDALRVVHARAEAMQATAPGAMLAVMTERAQTLMLASEFGVELAAENGEQQYVLSGALEQVEALEAACQERGITARRLAVDRAFHSRMMDPALDALRQAVTGVVFGRLRVAVVSNLDGVWCDGNELSSPEYWLRHARAPVAFRQGLDTLLAHGVSVVLEIGPGNGLSRMANRHGGSLHAAAVQNAGATPATFVYQRLASLWRAGCAIDWQRYYAHEQRTKVHLPTYPFERKRYWLERTERNESPSIAADVDGWLYRPVLRALPDDMRFGHVSGSCWLIFDDASSCLSKLIAQLRADGATVCVVRPGPECLTGEAIVFDPAAKGAWARLAQSLRDRNMSLNACIYAWQLATQAAPRRDMDLLLQFARFLPRFDFHASTVHLTVLSMAEPSAPAPLRAMLSGLLRVLPQEVSGLRTRFLVASPDAELIRAVPAILDTQAYMGLLLAEKLHTEDYETVSTLTDSGLDFRPEGRYLVVGGLGKVGRKLTHRLAAEMPLRLALVGRLELDQDCGADIVDLFDDCIDTSVAVAMAAREMESAGPDNISTVNRNAAHRLLRDLSVAAVVEYAIKCGLKIQTGVEWPLDEFVSSLCKVQGLSRIVQTMLRVLVEGGVLEVSTQRIRVLRDVRHVDTVQAIECRIADEQADFSGSARRLAHCAQVFQEVLLAGRSGVSVLYPDGSADFLRATATSGSANANFQEAVEALRSVLTRLAETADGRVLRILEIGGGNGSLTRQLAPLLDTMPVRYCFTDIGASFVKNARRLAEENGYRWLSARTLDISRDPLEQGFAAGEFDLVIGYNVLHIAPRLEQAIVRLSSLLSSGGALAVLETVKWMPWAELVWGLTEDWWRFEDVQLRADSPLLPSGTWKALFERIGFANSTVLARVDATDALILAAGPPERLRRTTIANSTVYRERIDHVRDLIQRGARVVYYRADIANAQQVGRICTDLNQRYGGLDGLVFAATTGLRGMNLIEDLDDDQIKAEFAAKCAGLHGLLPLCDALRPDFAVVMSSMSSVLGGIGHAAYATANSFQDAWCSERTAQGGSTRWLALNWDAWGNADKTFGTSVARHQMSEGEAVQVLRRALRATHGGHLLVSRHSLQERVAQWLGMEHLSTELETDLDTPNSSDTCERIIELWRELLGRMTPISPESDFLALGGDSLQAVQLISLIRRRFGRHISLAEFVRAPTVKNLVELVERSNDIAWSPLVTLRTGEDSEMPLFCIHPGGGGIQCYRTLSEALDMNVPIHAIQSRQFGPDGLPLHRTIVAMAEDYRNAIQAVHKGGPLILVGYCFGGLVAYEIASQLEAAGQQVERLVIIDSHPPGVDDGFFDQRHFIETQISSAVLLPASADWLDKVAALNPEGQARAVCERIDWTSADRSMEPLVARTVLEMILSNFAKNEYSPKTRLRAQVHLMRIDDEVFHRESNSLPDLGWGRFCTQSVNVSWLEGDHRGLFNADRINRVATRLRSFIAGWAPE